MYGSGVGVSASAFGAFPLSRSAQCYYACEKSVTRAAAQLYVHKNTLLYRLHKLWSTLGVDDSGEFQQEFTVRLILEYYLGKQGPRALK